MNKKSNFKKKKQVLNKLINRKILVSGTFEIIETKIRNGIVYLKIVSGDNRYKWINYSTANNDSEKVE